MGHVQKRLGKAVIDLRTKPPMETVKVTRPGIRARKATKDRPAVKASPRFTGTVTKEVQVGGQGGRNTTTLHPLDNNGAADYRLHLRMPTAFNGRRPRLLMWLSE